MLESYFMMKRAPMNAYPLPEGPRAKPNTLRTGHVFFNNRQLMDHPELTRVRKLIHQNIAKPEHLEKHIALLDAFIFMATQPLFQNKFHFRFFGDNACVFVREMENGKEVIYDFPRDPDQRIIVDVKALYDKFAQDVPQAIWQALGIDTQAGPPIGQKLLKPASRAGGQH